MAREALHLRALPPPVAGFYVRAWLTALRAGDRFTLASATRPTDVSRLLALARGHAATVELGTGTAWTTIALALADPARRVVSYDPEVRSQREKYLRLIPQQTRARIELRNDPAEKAQPAPGSVGFLFIDCSHDRETTAAAFAFNVVMCRVFAVFCCASDGWRVTHGAARPAAIADLVELRSDAFHAEPP